MSAPVRDPFGAARDPGLPFLPAALDPDGAERRLGPLLGEKHIRITEIRVVRHKPGRRCLVEYDVETRDGRPTTILGKARARGSVEAADLLLRALASRGFGPDARDGISIPEPLGTIREFRMSLQRKAPGLPASRLLSGPGGSALARRIAEAACKLHRAGVPSRRVHTKRDELRIVGERLEEVAGKRPEWSARLRRLWTACQRVAARVAEPDPPAPIHRDFYPDQIVVDGDRMTLLDFDLYSEGDPAVDAGNFLAHVTEQALRLHGAPEALSGCEHAFEERFLELAGAGLAASMQAYQVLTLARHVWVSTRLPERRPYTEALLDLCESRLGGERPVPARLGVS